MNDNVKHPHVARQGVDHLEGQMDLIDFAKAGAPSPQRSPFEPLPENVEVLNVVTSHDLPVNRVLQKAFDEGLETVLVLGYGKDGSEYFASSVADGAENLWLMERAKHRMMKLCDNAEDEPATPTKA